VTNEPRYMDLEKLFEMYKGKEPTPTSDTPGFKAPHKARMAYFSLTPDLPYFQEKARALVLAQSLQHAVAPMNTMLGGGPDLLTLPFLLKENRDQDRRVVTRSLQASYLAYEDREKNLSWDVSPFQRGADPIFRDSHLYRPRPLASTVVQALSVPTISNAGVLGGVLSISAALAGPAALSHESERWSPEWRLSGATLTPKPYLTAASLTVLSPTGDNSFLLTAALTAAKVAPVPPVVLSPREMGPLLLKQAIAQETRAPNRLEFGPPNLFTDAIKEYKTELSKLKTVPEKEAFIQATLKKFGIEKTYYQMEKADDLYAMDSDKALKPLRDAYVKQAPSSLSRRPDFGALLLQAGGVFEPKELVSTGTGDSDRTYYVYWKTEDVKAKEPASLEQVRSEVEAAWRWQVARALAQEKAQEIDRYV